MNIINIIIGASIGYVFGSIPWALLIGKIFYKKDIRKYGSKNLGGTNAGRVLGAKAGISVIILDALKGAIIVLYYVLIANDLNTAVIAGLFACIGHCFPLFANFKGGKGVSTALGYNLIVSIFVVEHFTLLFLAPAFIFFTVLSLTKYVSLSSILWLTTSTLIIFIIDGLSLITFSYICLLCFIVYRHKGNIQRLFTGQERKVSWIK